MIDGPVGIWIKIHLNLRTTIFASIVGSIASTQRFRQNLQNLDKCNLEEDSVGLQSASKIIVAILKSANIKTRFRG
jgi:hypothetical protein